MFFKCSVNVFPVACVGVVLFMNNKSINSSCEGKMP